MPIDVHLVTPDREVWSGSAETVVARGVDGEVGILNGHAPLLIHLAIGPLRILRDGGPEIAAVVDGGFLHVTSGDEGTRVDVMATGADLASEIDLDAIRRRADELQTTETGLAEAEVESQKAELRKVLARIELAG